MTENVIAKKYMSDNEKFADVFNYILYDGKPVIKPEALYDALEYERQMNCIRKEHRTKKDLNGGEFVSGFAKTDKLVPIITLVVYFGDKEWDGPRTLHDMFNIDDKNLLKHIGNYSLNLIVPAEIQDLNKFNSDFKYVMKFLQNTRDDDKLYKIMEEYKSEYGDVEMETAMLLNKVANLKLNINEKEGKVDMCKAWEDRIEKGRQEARKEEREKAEQEKEKLCKAWEDRIEKGRQEARKEEREKAEQEKEKLCKDMKEIIDNAKNNRITTDDLIEQLGVIIG